jgi:hypothetical protein
MKRRIFLTGAALAAAGGMGGQAMAKKVAPDYMPIVKAKMESGEYQPFYEEREITAPVDLCDAGGRLNPGARGWSRKPLTRANLSGHWGRKKRWNFWNWISPEFSFSVTLSDLDYAGFCAVGFIDFTTRKSETGIALKRGNAIVMPEQVDRTVTFSGSGIEYSNVNEGGDIKVDFTGRAASGKRIKADFTIKKSPAHESLNIVAPWSDERFQMNSKHNTLPCVGTIVIGEKTYEMKPETCHAVQDFGRGMWPYRAYWNWGVATGMVDGVLVGVNTGAKWTTGTGANENGLYIGGKLYKIMEDLDWRYDSNDWMKPWRLTAPHTNMLDLTLTPHYEEKTKLSLGVMSTGGVNCFGRWNGVIRFEGQEVQIKDMMGWAEEFRHRW